MCGIVGSSNFLAGEIKNSCPSGFAGTGDNILRCHPAWRVACAHLACTTMHRHLVTECRSVSHTPGGLKIQIHVNMHALFPIALESPFSGILFCCNFTICSSLGERCSRLLTLSQRFFCILPRVFPLVKVERTKIFSLHPPRSRMIHHCREHR